MHRILTALGALIFSVVAAIATMPMLDSHGWWKWHTLLTIEERTLSVKLFAKDYGRVPTQEEGLDLLIGSPENGTKKSQPYLRPQHVPHDIWDSPYIYKVTKSAKQSFIIYSAGPNHIDDEQGYDDVTDHAKDYACELYSDCKTLKDHLNTTFLVVACLALLTFLYFLLAHFVKKYQARSRQRH